MQLPRINRYFGIFFVGLSLGAYPLMAAELEAHPSRPPAARLSDIFFRGPRIPKLSIHFQPPKTPLQLEPAEGANFRRTPQEITWILPVSFTIEGDGVFNILHNALGAKQSSESHEGRANLNLPVRYGTNSFKLTVIAADGKTEDYEITASVDKVAGDANAVQVKGYLIGGPVFYQRSIQRTGAVVAAAGGTPLANTSVLGFRGIYRHRLLKSMTDRLPGAFKFFFDGSGTFGKTMSGDSAAQGMPIFADGRITIELLEASKLRFEMGAGLGYFRTGMTTTQAGDIEQFLGFVLSGRVGYPITSSIIALMGANFTLPSSAQGGTNTFVTQPLEGFFSLSTPLGRESFLEVRFKYMQYKTQGTISGFGAFERIDKFIGPELLLSKQF